MRDLYRWQHDALTAWHRCGRKGVIEAVTGSGKTDVAITAIDDALERGLFVLVIVPSRVLMEQWNERLVESLPESSIGRLGDGDRDRPADCDVLVTTRHSAASRVPLPKTDAGGLLVADECHGFGGVVLRKSLLPEYQERLGLTATLERSDDAVESILLPYFGGICYRYDFGAAIGDGVCAQPRVAFVAVPLTAEERDEYDATEGAIVAARRVLKNIPGVPHTPFGDFLAAVHHLAENDGGPDGKAANDYLEAFSARREIVATSSAKYESLGTFAHVIKTAKGSLIFTETVRAANHAIVRLDPHVDIEIITGGTGRSDRGQILDDLRDGTLDAVAAPRVLDEGVDVPNANLGIVVSASRTRRQMIQRMGRILRRKPLGSGARFVIIFSADTLEDPRYSDGGDGFLDEIENISESSHIFGPEQTAQLSEFLSYNGPAEIIEPETVGFFAAPNLSPDEITEWADSAPYLEIRAPELPTISQPKIVKEKPRLSTGEHPVRLEGAVKEWVLRCTGCGVASEVRAFKWQALEDKVDCTCLR
jgi:RNA polymerase primary sigma factor